MNEAIKKSILKLYKKIFKVLVLFCKPMTIPKKGFYGVTTLINKSYVEMSIISLQSFFFHLGRRLPCTIIDDGSLTKKDYLLIKKLMPGIKILSASKQKNNTLKKLDKYKNCHRYRSSNLEEKFNVKLFDPFINNDYKKIIYLDCDILFINKPREIENWIDNNKNISLYASEYGYREKENSFLDSNWKIILKMFSNKYKNNQHLTFNSGFFCVDKNLFNLKKMDKILSYMYEVGLAETWTTEQLTLSYLIAEEKNKNVNPLYLHLTRFNLPENKILENARFLHFAYKSKPYFYKFATLELIKNKFFKK